VHRSAALAIAAFLISAAARAQAGSSSDVDSIASGFRAWVDPVAAAAGFGSLHDGGLPPGVRREVRAYVGFGLGFPQDAARIWEDSSGAHGWLGVWWPGTRLEHEVIQGAGADSTELMQENAAWVAQVRKDAKRLGCIEFRARADRQICTLPAKGADWAVALASLDSLGVARIPQQPAGRFGGDGFVLLVEYRDTTGYRAYCYWMPSAESSDPDERAAAKILDVLAVLYRGAMSR
jgi:hypothetical protein